MNAEPVDVLPLVSDSQLLSPSGNELGQESGPTSSNSSETESEHASPTGTQDKLRSSGRSRKEPNRFDDQFGYSTDDLIEKNKERNRKVGEPRPREPHPAVTSVLSSIEAAASNPSTSSSSSPFEYTENDSFEELENLLGKRKIDVSQATASQLRQLREMLSELQEIKREIAFLKTQPTVRRPPPPLPTMRPVRSFVTSAAGAPPAKRKKRSHKKKMRDEEKQKLYSDICSLPADKLCEVLNFVKQICPDAIKYSAPDEAEIEINEIDNDNLWRLHRLCKRLSLLPPLKK